MRRRSIKNDCRGVAVEQALFITGVAVATYLIFIEPSKRYLSRFYDFVKEKFNY